jgi:succinate dehydrogenase / fumarate reductase flavoprotein subunit
MHMAEYCKQAAFRPVNKDSAAKDGAAQLDRIRNNNGDERPSVIRREMQAMMDDQVGVYRTGAGLEDALDKLSELQARYKRIRVEDKGYKWNTDLMEAWELGALLDLAEVTAFVALARTESRGSHYREDYPQRDDANFLKHSLVWKNGTMTVKYKPVRITRIPPQERKY